jgi:hypothetical protein
MFIERFNGSLNFVKELFVTYLAEIVNGKRSITKEQARFHYEDHTYEILEEAWHQIKRIEKCDLDEYLMISKHHHKVVIFSAAILQNGGGAANE